MKARVIEINGVHYAIRGTEVRCGPRVVRPGTDEHTAVMKAVLNIIMG